MLLAIEELKRAHSYHQRQLEENLQKIKSKQESIELLKKANEQHLEVIGELNAAIGMMKKDIESPMPIGKYSMDSIPQKGAM